MGAHIPLNTCMPTHMHKYMHKQAHTPIVHNCAGPLVDVSMQTSHLVPEVHVPFAQCACLWFCLCAIYATSYECVFIWGFRCIIFQVYKKLSCAFEILCFFLSACYNCLFLCSQTQTISHYSAYTGFYYRSCIKCVPRLKLPWAQGFSAFVQPPAAAANAVHFNRKPFNRFYEEHM